MTERYEPASDFLKAVANGDVPLHGHEFADMNLRTALALMRDDDLSNRDWATLLVAQLDLDTDKIRNALLIAAQDTDMDVRGEALVGLAQRDRLLTLPLVQREFAKAEVSINAFEAAEIIADASLIDLLAKFQGHRATTISTNAQLMRSLPAKTLKPNPLRAARHARACSQ